MHDFKLGRGPDRWWGAAGTAYAGWPRRRRQRRQHRPVRWCGDHGLRHRRLFHRRAADEGLRGVQPTNGSARPGISRTPKHRDMFAADPARYAPQYGGYCTLGVGLDEGHAAENIDPERAWRIIEGKLYFVYDPTYVEDLDGPAREEWLAKRRGELAKREGEHRAGKLQLILRHFTGEKWKTFDALT